MDQAVFFKGILATLVLLACVLNVSTQACTGICTDDFKFDSTLTTVCTIAGTDCTCASGGGETCACVAGYTYDTTSRCVANTPTVEAATVIKGNDHTVTCNIGDTPSADVASYTWTGLTTVTTTTNTNTQEDIAATIAAVTCELVFTAAVLNSATSAAVALTVQSAGVNCADSDLCTAAKFATGTCSIDGSDVCTCDDDACTCATGYSLDTTSDSCKLNAPTVTGAGAVSYKTGTITLTCTPDSATPSADVAGYTWTVQGTGVATTTATHQLTNVQIATTSVVCTVTHSNAALNSPDSASVDVTLQATAVTCEDENTLCVGNGYLTGSCSISSSLACTCASGGTCTATCNAASQCTSAEFDSATNCAISATGVCSCVGTDCTCNTGYAFITSSKRCLAGLVCTTDTECTAGNTAATDETPYSTCNTDHGVCNCADGYYLLNTACERAGKDCTVATVGSDCNGAPYAGTCDSTLHCDCANNYAQVFDDCSSANGKPCTGSTRDVDCPSSDSKYTGACTNNRCVCTSGEEVVGDCSGAAAMVGSLFLLALTAMMSRLF